MELLLCECPRCRGPGAQPSCSPAALANGARAREGSPGSPLSPPPVLPAVPESPPGPTSPPLGLLGWGWGRFGRLSPQGPLRGPREPGAAPTALPALGLKPPRASHPVPVPTKKPVPWGARTAVPPRSEDVTSSLQGWGWGLRAPPVPTAPKDSSVAPPGWHRGRNQAGAVARPGALAGRN